MTKAEANRLLGRIYKWMREGAESLHVTRFLPPGQWANVLDGHINMHPQGAVLQFFLHEALHEVLRVWDDEEYVERMEWELSGMLSDRQWENLLVAMGDLVREGRNG